MKPSVTYWINNEGDAWLCPGFDPIVTTPPEPVGLVPSNFLTPSDTLTPSSGD